VFARADSFGWRCARALLGVLEPWFGLRNNDGLRNRFRLVSAAMFTSALVVERLARSVSRAVASAAPTRFGVCARRACASVDLDGQGTPGWVLAPGAGGFGH